MDEQKTISLLYTRCAQLANGIFSKVKFLHVRRSFSVFLVLFRSIRLKTIVVFFNCRHDSTDSAIPANNALAYRSEVFVEGGQGRTRSADVFMGHCKTFGTDKVFDSETFRYGPLLLRSRCASISGSNNHSVLRSYTKEHCLFCFPSPRPHPPSPPVTVGDRKHLNSASLLCVPRNCIL